MGFEKWLLAIFQGQLRKQRGQCHNNWHNGLLHHRGKERKESQFNNWTAHSSLASFILVPLDRRYYPPLYRPFTFLFKPSTEIASLACPLLSLVRHPAFQLPVQPDKLFSFGAKKGTNNNKKKSPNKQHRAREVSSSRLSSLSLCCPLLSIRGGHRAHI